MLCFRFLERRVFLCLSFSFSLHILSSQTPYEDDFSGDEWLSFTFLGVMEAS